MNRTSQQKVLVLGGTGQVGTCCVQELSGSHIVSSPPRNLLDLSEIRQVSEYLDKTEFDVLINAAAFTDVDKAETDKLNAYALNAALPKILATSCSKKNALLIHFSTDYVFDGSGYVPWIETDDTNHLNYYGETKLEGEEAVKSLCNKYFIFRTSWVFSEFGKNFVKTMIRLFAERDEIKVVCDQVGSPTSASYLASVARQALQINNYGIYHVACTGYTTWLEFATKIRDEALTLSEDTKELKEIMIKPIKTSEFNSGAARPLNSRLDCRKWEKVTRHKAPHWEIELSKVLKLLGAAS